MKSTVSIKNIHYNKAQANWLKSSLEIIVALCIMLFIYAALTKLLAYEQSTLQLARIPMFKSTAGFIAWFIPASELTIAAFLGFEKTRLLGLYSFLGMMIMFTLYIAYNLFISDIFFCVCGGALEMLTWSEHLLFNIAFILLVSIGIAIYRRQNKNLMMNSLTKGGM